MAKVYEDFHKAAQKQKKIINRRNFTYRVILDVIDTYVVAPKKILDIGCGVGTLSLFLAQKGNTVQGIDISRKGIATAKNNAKSMGITNVTFATMNYPIEVPREKYDIIICSEVIEHLIDDNKAVKTMYKQLNKGGIAIISTPSVNAPMYRLGLAKAFDTRVGHIRRYSLHDLVQLSKRNGFTILDTRRTEGVVRNFLFVNPIAGKFVRFVKYFVTDIVSAIDDLSLKAFGESQIFIIVEKP